jgi:hypothetical protein
MNMIKYTERFHLVVQIYVFSIFHSFFLHCSAIPCCGMITIVCCGKLDITNYSMVITLEKQKGECKAIEFGSCSLKLIISNVVL